MAITGAAGLVITTFAKRPDLLREVFGPEIQSAVPEFMRHDPVAALYYGDGRLDRYREFGLVAVYPAQPNRPSPARSVCRSPFVTAMVDEKNCRMPDGAR